MPDKPLTKEQKQALKTMRARLGPVSAERREENKRLVRARKAIRGALAAAPATVPQIAAAADLPTDVTLWHVTAMKKYGQVREAGQDGDYVQYALAEEAEASSAPGESTDKPA